MNGIELTGEQESTLLSAAREVECDDARDAFFAEAAHWLRNRSEITDRDLMQAIWRARKAMRSAELSTDLGGAAHKV